MVEYDRTKVAKAKTTHKAVKNKCLDCMGGEKARVKDCPISDCILWPHRFGITPAAAKKRGYEVGDDLANLNLKVIRAECIYCMGDGAESYKYIRECSDNDCGLYLFRFGKLVS